jgi:hypothetical protein
VFAASALCLVGTKSRSRLATPSQYTESAFNGGLIGEEIMSSRIMLSAALMLSATAASAAEPAANPQKAINVELTGFREVPAVITGGKGKARLRVQGQSIQYELSYDGLEGGDVLFAHIHIGQDTANGAVATFLCGGGGKPACPASGTVTGTIVPADIQAIVPQSLGEDDFAGLIRAIRAGTAYLNVHTTQSPAGEIRGDIKP